MLTTGILICCTGHFWSCSFVYLASVCRSLQCLISALTQGGGGGLLFRFTCSVVLQGGRGAADRYHWPVWGALAVFWPHWVCLPLMAHVLHCSGSRLLYMEPALSCLRFQFLGTPKKRRLDWACVLCLPRRSSSGSQELDEGTLPGAVRLLPSVVPASVSSRW